MEHPAKDKRGVFRLSLRARKTLAAEQKKTGTDDQPAAPAQPEVATA